MRCILLFLLASVSIGKSLANKADSLLVLAEEIERRNPRQALQLRLQALELAQVSENVHSELVARVKIGNYYRKHELYDRSLEQYLELIKTATYNETDVNDSLAHRELFQAYSYASLIFKEFELHEECINFRYKAIQSLEKFNGKISNKLNALLEIQRQYRKLYNYDKALKIAQKVRNDSDKGTKHHLDAINAIGIIYSEMGEVKMAEEYFERLLNLALESEQQIFVVWANHNIADANYNIGNYTRSEEYFLKGVEEARKLPQKPFLISNSLRDLSRTYIALSKYEMAQETIDEAIFLTHSKERKDPLELSVLYGIAADIQAGLNNTDKASNYRHTSDSIKTAFDNSKARINFLNTQSELSDIMDEFYAGLTTQRKELKTKNILIAVIVGVSCMLVMLLAYHVYQRSKTRREIDRALEEIFWKD